MMNVIRTAIFHTIVKKDIEDLFDNIPQEDANDLLHNAMVTHHSIQNQEEENDCNDVNENDYANNN